VRIILASQSPYRKKALDVLGLEYETVPSNFDESTIRDENPERLAEKLSTAKAETVGRSHPDSIVIAGDLFVVYAGRIYEKPKDEGEAKAMLKAFSGNTVSIVAGLAVYNSATKKMLATAESCRLKFRELTDFEVDDYVRRYPVLKCAGAFEADGIVRFTESGEGTFLFFTGLPVNRLVEFLREQGVNV